jgi:hypothetical protein
MIPISLNSFSEFTPILNCTSKIFFQMLGSCCENNPSESCIFAPDHLMADIPQADTSAALRGALAEKGSKKDRRLPMEFPEGL